MEVCPEILDVTTIGPGFIAWSVVIVSILSGIGKVAAVIASKTDSKTDDRLVAGVNRILWGLSTVLAYIAPGMPKELVKKKAGSNPPSK